MKLLSLELWSRSFREVGNIVILKFSRISLLSGDGLFALIQVRVWFGISTLPWTMPRRYHEIRIIHWSRIFFTFCNRSSSDNQEHSKGVVNFPSARWREITLIDLWRGIKGSVREELCLVWDMLTDQVTSLRWCVCSVFILRRWAMTS